MWITMHVTWDFNEFYFTVHQTVFDPSGFTTTSPPEVSQSLGLDFPRGHFRVPKEFNELPHYGDIGEKKPHLFTPGLVTSFIYLQCFILS